MVDDRRDRRDLTWSGTNVLDRLVIATVTNASLTYFRIGGAVKTCSNEHLCRDDDSFCRQCGLPTLDNDKYPTAREPIRAMDLGQTEHESPSATSTSFPSSDGPTSHKARPWRFIVPGVSVVLIAVTVVTVILFSTGPRGGPKLPIYLSMSNGSSNLVAFVNTNVDYAPPANKYLCAAVEQVADDFNLLGSDQPVNDVDVKGDFVELSAAVQTLRTPFAEGIRQAGQIFQGKQPKPYSKEYESYSNALLRLLQSPCGITSGVSYKAKPGFPSYFPYGVTRPGPAGR
jgi:hypothetical protein